MEGSFLTTIFLSCMILVSNTNHVKGKIVGNGCDLFQGKWVMDDTYPLYSSSECPFIEGQFDCRKNHRPDEGYTKYKWQPTACAVPRFDGVGFLKKMKGKRVMFVGDSLSLNQWQSLTCMLHVAAPQEKYISKTLNGLSNFTFPGFDLSVMFYRNAFLVDIVSEPRGRVLRLDSISSSRIWGGVDVVIFDSWHWWLHTGRKQPWDWVVYGNTTVKDIDRMSAYTKALTTWAKWIDSNVDPAKTQVFFQGVSPDHASGLGWNGKNCVGEKEPLNRALSPHPAELVLENVLRSMEKPVFLLNITALSQLRIDAHPSVYGHGGHRDMDCTHWCLSGVPDIWNELFFAMIK